MKLFRRRAPIREPDLDTVPPMAGRSIGMDFLVSQLHDSGVNRQVPMEGDVVVVLTTDSMGSCISRDERHRSTGRIVDFPDSDSPPAVWLTGRDGRETLHNVGSLRATPLASRTWISVQ